MVETAHRGASTALPELRGWNPPNLSADAELVYERERLVDRSRDIERNHGVAAGALQTYVDNIVGQGLHPEPRPDWETLGRSKEWAREVSQHVKRRWRLFAEDMAFDAARQQNFRVMTGNVVRYGVMNGEAVALPLWLPDRVGTQHATAMQLIEPDRVSNPHDGPDSEQLRQGVEINRFGEPVAYHVRKSHPGDWFLGGTGLTLGQGEWERIPARTSFGRARVVHALDIKRAGQHRGKPLISAILPKFKDIDRYERAELQTAIVNALIAAFIKTPLDQEAIVSLFGGGEDAYKTYLNTRNEWQARLSSSAVIPLFPGDEVTPFIPGRPSSVYPAYVDSLYQEIATGLNLPRELLLKDFTRSNYSSARAALLEAWRFFMGWRQWAGESWATPVYALWLEEEVDRGEVEGVTIQEFVVARAAYTRCEWIGPGREHVDPEKGAKATEIELRTGMTTWDDECRRKGKNWEDHLEQRGRELAKVREVAAEHNVPVEWLLAGDAVDDGGGTRASGDDSDRRDGTGRFIGQT